MNQAIVRTHLMAAANASDSDAKGEAYEALVAYLFTCVSGCIVGTWNHKCCGILMQQTCGFGGRLQRRLCARRNQAWHAQTSTLGNPNEIWNVQGRQRNHV